MDVMLNCRGGADQNYFVFEKGAISKIMFPQAGEEDLENWKRLVRFIRTESDHPGLARWRNSIGSSDLSQGPRTQRLIDWTPRLRAIGLVPIHPLHNLRIGHRV